MTPDDEPGYDRDLMAAVADLGSALRELVDATTLTTVRADELRTAAAEVRAVSGRLAASRRPLEQLHELDDILTFRRVHNPVSGVGSAIAPPLQVRRVDGGVVGTAVLGPAYEGPPGYAHGGMSALLLDQLLGAAAIAAGLWGMTVNLDVDYRGPVPLGEPLELRARVVGEQGRRTVVTGTIATAAAPGANLVEGRGTFVMPRPERLEGYFGAIRDASGRPSPPTRPTDATSP